MSFAVATPMQMTSVRPLPASPDQSWLGQALALARDEADRARMVAVGEGSIASAAQPSAADTPGITSTGSPAARTASTSSPPRPKMNGSPPFSRTTIAPVFTCATISALIASCDSVCRARLLGDRDALRRGGRDIEHARVDQPVMDQDIGSLQCRDRANGQQPGVARAGTNEDHAPTRGRIEKACHGECRWSPGRQAATDACLGRR